MVRHRQESKCRNVLIYETGSARGPSRCRRDPIGAAGESARLAGLLFRLRDKNAGRWFRRRRLDKGGGERGEQLRRASDRQDCCGRVVHVTRVGGPTRRLRSARGGPFGDAAGIGLVRWEEDLRAVSVAEGRGQQTAARVPVRRTGEPLNTRACLLWRFGSGRRVLCV